MTTQPKVKFEEDGNGGQQQQPRQAGNHRNGRKQKSNQQSGGKSAYRSPIDEIKDKIYSVGSTTFKETNNAIADYGQLHLGLTADVAAAFRDGRQVVITPPARPSGTGTDGTGPADEFEVMEWKMQYSEYMKEMKKARTSLQSLFPLLLGQCDDYLRGRVKNRSDFPTLLSSSDTIGLGSQAAPRNGCPGP